MKLAALALAATLAGCAATARGNAENVCTFVFLTAAMPALGVVGAAACSFGLELIKEPESTPEGD